MIRINLLSVKRKRKTSKPLPTFIVSVTLITVLTIVILVFVFFYVSSGLQSAQERYEANKHKIAELKDKIKEVDNFEKLNRDYEEKNKLIEQLRKNQNVPVTMLEEISKNLPNGVWLNSMAASGSNVTIEGFAFTNSDVVAYVNNLKNSKPFSDVNLQESRLVEIEKIMLYQFKLTFRMAA